MPIIQGLCYYLEIKNSDGNRLHYPIALRSTTMPPPESGHTDTLGGLSTYWHYRTPNNVSMTFFAGQETVTFFNSFYSNPPSRVDLHVKYGDWQNPRNYIIFKQCFLRSYNCVGFDDNALFSNMTIMSADWVYLEKENVLATPTELIDWNEASIRMEEPPPFLHRGNEWRLPVNYEEEPNNSIDSVNWRQFGF